MNREAVDRILLCWTANPLIEIIGIAKHFQCLESDVAAIINEHCSPTSIAHRECDRRRSLAMSRTQITQPEFIAGRKSPEFTGRTSNWTGRGSHWEAAKRAARERDSGTCKICGITEDLQGRKMDVHHLKPYYSFDVRKRANRLNNLVCLCRRCHSKFERGNLVLESHSQMV
jgi:hypothetical protein